MNTKDLSELKRRLNPEHHNPTIIRGCYVDHAGQVIANFTEDVNRLSDGENQKYMALFRKVLSGTIGQNLLPINFTPRQTMEDESYALIARLRNTALKDDEAVDAICAKITEGLVAEHVSMQSVSDAQKAENYLILLLHDGYDVPFKDDNGEIDCERSGDVFSYVLCCVCPVKQTKAALSYIEDRTTFRDRAQDWIVAAPEMGFLFPVFEQRAADVYAAMFYTKDSGNAHEGIIRSVFNTEPYMPAKEQKEVFRAVLATSLADECSMDVLQEVQASVSEMIEKQAEDKTAQPLNLTRDDISGVLADCGVSDEKTAAFEAQFDETFGQGAVLPAVNVIPPKEFKVQTPGISIRVDPDHRDFVQTRMIDGRCYIMVLADGDVEVNGMIVKVDSEHE